MKKTIDQIIEESLNKESIFPIDSPAPGNKVLSVPYPGENKEDKDEEDDTLEFSEASKLYVEGKISGKQFSKIVIEHKEILITEGFDLATIAKFTMAFLRGLRIIRKVSKATNPLVAVGLECATFVCRKALVPRVVKGLKYSTMAISDPMQRAQIHSIIDILAKVV